MLPGLIIACMIVSAQPVEIVIDCSTWPGKVETRLEVRLETWDGKAIKDEFILPEDTDPSSPRGCFRIILKHHGWKFAYRDDFRIVVWGSAVSPIKSVTFRSTGWAPGYVVLPGPRWVPLAPAPREKKEEK